MNAIQLRIGGAVGCGLPLRPTALVALNEFELHHVLAVLDLDEEQRDCAEAAITSVRDGTYPSKPEPLS